MAAHARVSDGYLLNRIGSLSLSLTSAQGYGTISQVIGALLKGRASTISVLRMPAASRFRALLPAWLPSVLSWDLVNSQFGRFEYSPENVQALLARYGIDASFYLDEEAGTSQIFAAEVDGGAIDNFPLYGYAYLFAEGTFLHVDSGDLELGIVRDSTLNSTNDFQVFGETFENVARIGPAQAAKKIQITICPSGTVATPATAITCS
jgi:hypothetical protein